MIRGASATLFALAALGGAAVATGAVTKPRAKPAASPASAPLIQSCAAHRFETTMQLTGPDGKLQSKQVRLCGTEGQTNADWVRTLRDAVRKTADNPQMQQAAKEQIIAAVNAEINRLSMPALSLPPGGDISKLPKNAVAQPIRPLSRDYDSLPQLPAASAATPPSLLGPGGLLGQSALLTLRCALAGDEDRPSTCDTIDKDTVIVVRADEPLPAGVSLRFLRKGESRAELKLPAMRVGQTAHLRLPPAVCVGVVRSKVEIQSLRADAPAGAMGGTIGEYDLRC